MKKRLAQRGVIVALAAAASAVVVHFSMPAGGEHPGPVNPDAAARGAEPKSGGATQLLVAARPGLSVEAQGNIFAGGRSAGRTPTSTVPAVAPRPAAPAFPYRYAGWFDSGSGARIYLLQRGGEVIVVTAGKMLDEVWRVDVLTEERIEVSFVPGGQQLSVALATLTGEATAQGATPASTLDSPGRTPAFQPAAAAAASLPVASAESGLFRAAGLPASIASAQPSSSVGVASGASFAAMKNASAGPGTSTTIPTGRLGVEAPGTGSMPTGTAQSGSPMSTSPAPFGTAPTNPTGKLGLE